MSGRPSAIIIGAGVAGLAAALRLAEAGRWPPRLIEREARAGGLARSLRVAGLTTDYGPHRIHTELPEVGRLIEAVAAPSLITVPRASRIYLRGQFLRYPPAPLDMARRLGPLRLARFMGSFAAEKLRGPAREETYESLMRAAFGGALYDFLLRPYSAKTWKIDPAGLHADTARVRVSAGSLAKMVTRLLRREAAGSETALTQFRYVRGGVEALPGHLWERAAALGATLSLGREVRSLELSPAGDRAVATLCAPLPDVSPGETGAPADIERIPGELFLSTAPLPELLGRLLPARPELAAAREAAAGLEYLDMILVCLVVGRERLSPDCWLYFPEPHLVFNRAYEAKNFDPTLGPPGQTILCLEITTRAGDPLWGESDAALAAEVTRQIAATGLLRAEEVQASLVHRLRGAYPLYKLDYETRLATALEGVARVGNLITLGRQGLFNHNNMDHSIAMGLEAAALVNERGAAEAARAWPEAAQKYRSMRIVD